MEKDKKVNFWLMDAFSLKEEARQSLWAAEFEDDDNPEKEPP